MRFPTPALLKLTDASETEMAPWFARMPLAVVSTRGVAWQNHGVIHGS
jgi:hypothetical protein